MLRKALPPVSHETHTPSPSRGIGEWRGTGRRGGLIERGEGGVWWGVEGGEGRGGRGRRERSRGVEGGGERGVEGWKGEEREE